MALRSQEPRTVILPMPLIECCTLFMDRVNLSSSSATVASCLRRYGGTNVAMQIFASSGALPIALSANATMYLWNALWQNAHAGELQRRSFSHFINFRRSLSAIFRISLINLEFSFLMFLPCFSLACSAVSAPSQRDNQSPIYSS